MKALLLVVGLMSVSLAQAADKTKTTALIREHDISIRILVARPWGGQQTAAQLKGLLKVTEDFNEKRTGEQFECKLIFKTGPKKTAEYPCIYKRDKQRWERLVLDTSTSDEILKRMLGDRAPNTGYSYYDEKPFQLALTKKGLPQMIGDNRRIDATYWLDVSVKDNALYISPEAEDHLLNWYNN